MKPAQGCSFPSGFRCSLTARIRWHAVLFYLETPDTTISGHKVPSLTGSVRAPVKTTLIRKRKSGIKELSAHFRLKVKIYYSTAKTFTAGRTSGKSPSFSRKGGNFPYFGYRLSPLWSSVYLLLTNSNWLFWLLCGNNVHISMFAYIFNSSPMTLTITACGIVKSCIHNSVGFTAEISR